MTAVLEILSKEGPLPDLSLYPLGLHIKPVANVMHLSALIELYTLRGEFYLYIHF